MFESRHLAFALSFAVALGLACDGNDGTSPPAPASIEVGATTTGAELDPDGYTIRLDTMSQALGINASITFGNLGPGEHTVELTEISANCTAAGSNPRTVTVSAGDTAAATFEVTCAPTIGSVEVTASTTGDDVDPNGYMVTVNGGAEESVAINGSTTFAGLEAGDHEVELVGLASNCTVDGSNPRTVTVVAGDTAATTFDVTCAPTTGSIEVMTATTGDDLDPDGYTVTVDDGTGLSAGSDDSITFTGLTAGDHEVELVGLASNCTVLGSNPRTVTVVAGEVASTDFDMTCVPAGTTPPFPSCTSDAYVTTGDPTEFHVVDLSTDPIYFELHGMADIAYDAIGFNPVDNYLYGMQNQTNTLVRINSIDGSVEVMGAVTGLPTNAGSYIAGEIGPDGTYYVRASIDATNLFIIDIDALAATRVELSGLNDGGGDLAWFDGLLYTVSSSNYFLHSIDPVSGGVESIGPTGVIEIFAAMFGASNGIFGFATSGGLVQFDPITGEGTLLADSPGLLTGDGARCVTAEMTVP